jgi:hypothetical protein
VKKGYEAYFAERTLPKKTSSTSPGLISGTLSMAAAGCRSDKRQSFVAITREGIYLPLMACEPSCGAVRLESELQWKMYQYQMYICRIPHSYLEFM